MIRLVGCDDHKLFAKGIVNVLSQDLQFSIDGFFDNAPDLIHYLGGNHADVVLLDLNMPKMNGFEAMPLIRKASPSCKVVVLSMYADRHIFNKCQKLGVDGYLLKDVEPNELITTIKQIYSDTYKLDYEHSIGQTHPPAFRDNFVNSFKLSKRELEIAQLIRQGLTNQAIAKKLFLSVLTVQTHRKNINDKLMVKNAAELVNSISKVLT